MIQKEWWYARVRGCIITWYTTTIIRNNRYSSTSMSYIILFGKVFLGKKKKREERFTFKVIFHLLYYPIDHFQLPRHIFGFQEAFSSSSMQKNQCYLSAISLTFFISLIFNLYLTNFHQINYVTKINYFSNKNFISFILFISLPPRFQKLFRVITFIQIAYTSLTQYFVKQILHLGFFL